MLPFQSTWNRPATEGAPLQASQGSSMAHFPQDIKHYPTFGWLCETWLLNFGLVQSEEPHPQDRLERTTSDMVSHLHIVEAFLLSGSNPQFLVQDFISTRL